VRHAASHLIDPLGRDLAAAVEWWELPSLVGPWDQDPKDGDPAETLTWPVAVVGEGPPLLLLHGFDSCFLEFRRLVPLLAKEHQLVIPDLFGFGFTPRPAGAAYNPPGVLAHLGAVLAQIGEDGKEHPIAYYSKKLLESEQKWDIWEREMSACVWAADKCRMYLLGNEFRPSH
jgi:hypothetical protein